ncbi:oxygen-regulated protein 1-like [Myripristis murdjan]|uniref:oxygen-regulated protein 1-like n=1 Tax=Myripristis murdjan TaxID=586833 RepID=UPI001175F6E3|nr:oxygen-regulated protein 1 [Myripristis murdjan]
MMNERGIQGFAPDQLSGSRHTFGTTRHPFLTDLCPSKRVCFYKSGDPQFSGLRMVINNRTFKSFDALLDSLSKKVPLPFGVRNITTPRGVHPVHTLDELEDGKSYICSDSRKVKPINLALARRKMPPWYHARPVTARRQAVQLARLHAGRATNKHEPVVVRTPKKLTVFRNGDPAVKYTVILQKRTTPTFESLLEYMTELMQFHVVKLYTPDGRRVDGLPALILCSGAVVAAGREPFKYASYNTQKSPSSTRLSSRRMGPRRLKAIHRKSIQEYIVNRIQNSITGSLCDFPSNPTDSMELEPGRTLESVAQTEGDTCLGYGTEGHEGFLPTDDDIEKSFRVNQDGSMTVEMRVRLTIKEEETVHWTTTLSRTSVANQFNTTHLPDPEPQLEQNSSLNSSPVDSQNPASSTDSMHWKKPKDDDDDDNDPPSLDNGVASENGDEEDNVKVQVDMASPRRAPTPGPRQVRKKQASVESITSVTAEEIQEGVVGSYMYREETESGAMTEQYCMVKQSSTRPVPKPRRMDSLTRNLTTFTSTEVADILQFEESGEEAGYLRYSAVFLQ